MTNTYTWNIANIEYAPSEDGLSKVAKTVHYRYDAVSSDTNAEGNPYSATAYGSIGLDAPESGNFTAFDDLTVEQIVAWVLAKLDTDEATLQAALDERIAMEKNPPVVSGLPASWS
jgi:hypothetical protein